MNKRITVLLTAALGLCLASSVQAGGDTYHKTKKQGVHEMKKQSAGAKAEAIKHLTLINVDLDAAASATKGLATLIDVGITSADSHFVALEQKIARSLAGATVHVSHYEDLGEHPDKVAEVKRHLKQAKAAAKLLDKAATVQECEAKLDRLATHLAATDTAFRELAQGAKFTLISNMRLQGMPVRGQDVEEQDVEKAPPIEQKRSMPKPIPQAPSPNYYPPM